jgi:PPK2 family polyphosphate:nucleotide phosphotransferase
VHSFKAPNSKELAHDYLWRVQPCLPERGHIAIFNRSYYEDVLIVAVHKLYKKLNIAKRCKRGDVIGKRYNHIRNFEEYLYDNGIHIVKIFLHLSHEEQGKRFVRRLDRPDKNWKFSEGDIAERGHWDKYQEAYENAITATATKEAPWFILPADDKPYARMIASEIIKKTLRTIDPAYPVVTDEHRAQLEKYRAKI